MRQLQPSSGLRRAQNFLGSSLIVMSGYVLSRGTGLLRDIVISAQFGTSAQLGAYRAAFKVTDLLYMVIIGGALGSSFIPVFIQIWQRESEERAWQLASAVVTWALAVLVFASGLLWLFAPQLTTWFYGGQGFDLPNLVLVTQLTRLFLLSPLLLGLGGLAMAALNALDRFTLPALAPATYNLGIIGGAILLAPTWGIWGLAWGVIAGALLYLLIQIPGLLGLGMRLKPTLGRNLPELRIVARQVAPRIIGQAAAQISILVTAALTARLALGAERLAGLDYAYQLMLLPYGVFSLSLSTVAFPRLARLFAEGRHAELEANVRQTLSMILLLTLPAAISLILLGLPLIRLLFQRGEFDQTSLQYTLAPLLGYATALPAFAASEILIRAFYAMQQTYIPVLIGLGQILLNLALGSLALKAGYGVGALALAFSLANNIEALLLFLVLQHQKPTLWRDQQFWKSIRAVSIANLALAVLLWATLQILTPFFSFLSLNGAYSWQQQIFPLILWLSSVGGIGTLIYVGIAAIFGSAEAQMLWLKVQNRLRRNSRSA